jgi:hypothetical protein
MTPLPNVYYRIQSVDFNEYLELWDLNDDKVLFRTLKKDSLQQQVGINFIFTSSIYPDAACISSGRLPKHQ